MKQLLSALILSVVILNTSGAQAEETPGGCYEHGIALSTVKSGEFCGAGSATLQIDENVSCFGTFPKAVVSGCKDTAMELVEQLHSEGSCDVFEEFESDFAKYILLEDLCDLGSF